MANSTSCVCGESSQETHRLGAKSFIVGLTLLGIAACSDSGQSDETKNVATDSPKSAVNDSASNQSASMKESTDMKAPIAKQVPYEMTHHGHTRNDPYYWLRDDERKDPEILAYLDAENQYLEKVMAHTNDLQDKLFEELTNRMKKDDSSVPVEKNGYFYYRRFEGEKEYPIYARKKGSLDSAEEIMLDGNKMAEGQGYFSIGSTSISTNSDLLAYSTDLNGRRIYTIEVKRLSDGKKFDDTLENTSGQIVWANDNEHLFYIQKDPQTLLGYKVYRHKLGTKQDQDVLVYEEKDKSFYTGIGKTRDDSMLTIYHSSTTKLGVSILDANNPTGDFSLFHPIEENLEYSFQKLGDWFYIRTNYNATNFRLMKAKVGATNDKTQWKEVLPYKDDVYLKDFLALQNYLLVSEKENGGNRIVVHPWNSIGNESDENKSYTMTFDDPVFVAGFTGNMDPNTDVARLYYSSLTTPRSTYDINLKTSERKLLKQDEVLGDFHPNNYQSERIFITARDGVKVPVSIVYRKDTFKKDGTNPLYQYGYGSYGATMEPFFSGSRLSLLDRGFVYAIAHIRGSQMLGRPWYEDGKMFNKMNTFTDFIDVTKALVEQKYGDKDRVFAAGGSAGGLLMGAIVNMNPELYKGIASHVPFVDVVTTMLDETIPLTTNEYDEWGNPNNKDSYEYMLSYSPYDQIKKQDYPHILVTTGLHDSQVQYFEPAKWVAKLRATKTDNNRLVFKTNMEAGHGGASGRFRRNKERALEYAFFIDLAGIKE